MTSGMCSRMIVVVLVTMVACRTGDTSPTEVDAARVFAGEAAFSRDASGNFLLSGPDDPTEVAEVQARDLALSYARTAGRWLRPSWEAERGAAINVDDLAVCGRAYYARSIFQRLPEGTPEHVRQYLGPRWLVSLCDRTNIPIVSVAVPTTATKITVRDGYARVTNGHGLTSFGIPTSVTAVPVTPEIAAAEVARATGRRVSRVPELVLPPPPYVPQLAKWRIVLEKEAPIKVTGEDTVTNTPEVYFGFGHTWFERGLMLGRRSGIAHSFVSPQNTGDKIALSLRPGLVDRFLLVNPGDR